jgi:hypothetical protein
LGQSLAEARTEIAERTTHMQVQWTRTQIQLEITQRIWPSLSEAHQAVQTETLNVLNAKLKAAQSKLQGLLKERTDGGKEIAVKRWKYMFVKPTLDETIKSLDRWQRMYDPTWYLMIKIADPLVDKELANVNALQDSKSAGVEAAGIIATARKVRDAVRDNAPKDLHLLLPSGGLDKLNLSSILYSSAKFAERPGKTGFIIESIHCLPGSYVGDMDKDVRRLATKLHYVDSSSFGVLKCKGFTKVKNSTGSRLVSFDLILETPTREAPRSLRNCLVAQTPHSLSERVELARQLARSVNYVHTLEFVHKSIRPESWIGFGESKLGSFFLIGFEQVRSAEGMSYFRGDADWERNIYRHPSRQGLNPGEKHCMQHDIYSLGVCLLEIGLWESFLLYPEAGKQARPNAELLRVPLQKLQNASPERIKHLLVQLAKRELPGRMGELYEQVVLNCLTCLDDDNTDFGDESEFDDSDGVSVGIRYIEKVDVTLWRHLIELKILTIILDLQQAQRDNVVMQLADLKAADVDVFQRHLDGVVLDIVEINGLSLVPTTSKLARRLTSHMICLYRHECFVESRRSS